MNNYNPIRHHRKSIRLKDYDYSKEGLYYITICTEDRICLFGKIISGVDINHEMLLNDAGNNANECWLQIPLHFPDVILHDHIIMPNHVHGIIELIPVGDVVGVENFQPLRAENLLPLRAKHHEFQKIIPHSIGSIVRGFKIGVTKWFRNNKNIVNIWQRNYYEHVIRNEQSYNRISDYIKNNSKNWENDDFFR
jgi:putative transposase